MKKRVVLIQGAFDLINYGHIRAFKFAKSKGDFLIVALNTNPLIKDYKKRDAVVAWLHKKRIIEACRYVDKVVTAPDFSPIKLLKRHKVDVYVISREWVPTKAIEIAYMKSKGGKVCISRRFKGVSTTAIKQRLLEEYLNATHSKVVPRTTKSGRIPHTARGNIKGTMLPAYTNGHAFGALR